jgi:hypothetical protein
VIYSPSAGLFVSMTLRILLCGSATRVCFAAGCQYFHVVAGVRLTLLANGPVQLRAWAFASLRAHDFATCTSPS